MKKFFRILLVFFLIACIAVGGIYFYFAYSKTPTAIAARTLKNFQVVDSAAINMNVDTGLKAEVGILQYFGIKDPEAVVNMNYDMNVYRNPALIHTHVDISAFDIDAIKDVEAIITEENGKKVNYYCWNDKWLKYIPEDAAEDSEISEGTVDNTLSGSAENESGSANVSTADMNTANGVTNMSSGDIKADTVKLSSESEKNESRQEENDRTGTNEFMADVINFKDLLEGIIDGSVKVEMREEPETRNDKECYVYDIDMTGDMLQKLISFTSSGEGLIPNLRENERMTGVLYIDSEKYLPEAMTIKVNDLEEHSVTIDQIKTTFSIETIDIDINVKEYNIGEPISIPADYVDINSLSDMTVMQWLNLALNFTGILGTEAL